jgi:hypothetical protein
MLSLRIFLLALVLLKTCGKDTDAVERKGLIGRWQLVETCISTGAACKPKQISNGTIIEFKSNGTYTIQNFTEGALTCNGSWKEAANTHQAGIKNLFFTPSCTGPITLMLSQNGNTNINLSPQCIEECRYTYKPIN